MHSCRHSVRRCVYFRRYTGSRLSSEVNLPSPRAFHDFFMAPSKSTLWQPAEFDLTMFLCNHQDFCENFFSTQNTRHLTGTSPKIKTRIGKKFHLTRLSVAHKLPVSQSRPHRFKTTTQDLSFIVVASCSATILVLKVNSLCKSSSTAIDFRFIAAQEQIHRQLLEPEFELESLFPRQEPD